MTAITSPWTLVYLFDATASNPNGDPDMDNRPRQLDDQLGLVTGISLKRKVRDYVHVVYRKQRGHDLFCGRSGITTDPAALCLERQLCDPGLEAEAGRRLGAPTRVSRTAKPKKGKKGAAKPEETVDGEGDGEASLTADAAAQMTWLLCQRNFDLRTFGGVLSTGKSGLDALHGSIQANDAISYDPIEVTQIAQTRQAASSIEEYEKKTSGGRTDGTFGRRYILKYGLYGNLWTVNPHRAAQSGCTVEDLAKVCEALLRFPLLDMAANRLIEPRRLFVFRHRSEFGNQRPFSLFESVTVTKREGVDKPLRYSDYQVSLDRSRVNAGIEAFEIGDVDDAAWTSCFGARAAA